MVFTTSTKLVKTSVEIGERALIPRNIKRQQLTSLRNAKCGPGSATIRFVTVPWSPQEGSYIFSNWQDHLSIS